MDGQGTKCRRNIAENFDRLSRVHEHYRQTDRRQMDGRQHANANMSSHSLMTIYCKFTVESAYEAVLKSVNVWQSYRQESCLSHVPCVPGHCPAER